MKKPDRSSSLLWLLFSLFVCWESRKLNIGTFHSPGPGLFPFWLAVILGGLSLLLFSLSFGSVSAGGEGIFKNIKWWKILLILVSLFAYSLVLEHLGFVLATFFLVILLIRIIERKNWIMVITVGVSSALLSYLVFQVWLQTQLPRGILGF